MSELKERFDEVFHEVFDENGEITACGRNKCKSLISLAKKLTPIYGDEDTGVMNVEAIKLLHEELFRKKK